MKKVFKKVMVVLTVLLLFTTVLPNKADKEADASISMTLAGIAATVGGSAMLPYALGAAGILAVGGVITNWDVAKDYGEKVIARMGGYDAASGAYVQNPDGSATVVYSPAMKLAMAQAVDEMPAFVPVSALTYNVGTFTLTETKTDLGEKYTSLNLSGLTDGDQVIIEYSTNSSASISFQLLIASGSAFKSYSRSTTGFNRQIMTIYQNDITKGYAYDGTRLMIRKGYQGSGTSATLDNVKVSINRQQSQTVTTADTFGTVADNVNARLLGMNAAIADNQAVTISADAQLLNASIDDLASISDATLTETQTQTGILSQIWNGLKNITGTIVAASSAVAASINSNMDQLWQDAGAIWSGMADTLTNIKADVNAKIGALSDAMAGGIDNIRTDIGTMMDNLRAGIDSLAASAAANMASWGQLTLDGIEAGIGTITSGLTNTWTKVTTAIDTAATATTTAINTGIGTITDGLTTITDWVIGFPAMFFSWFVPPDFSFLGPLITKATDDLENKFGTLPSLADIGSAITIQEKTIYDIEITVMGNNYKIVPIALKPTIDGARPFLTAAVNLTSITFLIHRNKRELFK